MAPLTAKVQLTVLKASRMQLLHKRGRSRAVSQRCRKCRARAAGQRGAVRDSVQSATRDGFRFLETSGQAILTTFTFPAALAREGVSITGSFKDWDQQFALRSLSHNTDLVRSIVLPPGTVQYKYVVDDSVWRHSPRDPITMDAMGSINNQKHIAVNAVITWHGDADEVYVSGSFLAWQELVPLRPSDTPGRFYVNCCLPNGKHHIRFLVDGEWALSDEMPIEADEKGEASNVISVNARHAFHIFMMTSWRDGTLHYRILDEHGEPAARWSSTELHPTQSRLGPWQTCSVPAMRSQDNRVLPCQLEFYIEGPYGKEDRPRYDDFYRLPAPGGYKLESGVLRPFPQACDAPFMLVSDVDGTMIDEDDFAQRCAANFREYWENSAALAGSILVYNTGRSIGQLTGLLGVRQDCMAVPDAIITAVGTKVFLLNRKVSRTNAESSAWEEDMGWSRLLDKDWRLDVVRSAAERCISDRVSWLDKGTEHPHRIALSVHEDELQRVIATVRDEVDRAGAKAQYVVSGPGERKYLDILSMAAGKRNAMEYVRAIYGVPRDRVVAAGDSGNDILMLEGDTPAIVVGNAQRALLDWVMTQEQTSRRVVLTDAPLARGLLEGLARHGLY